MPRTPGPVAKIMLGGRMRPMAFGFNEFSSLEDSLGVDWLEKAIKTRSLKAILAIIATGVGRFDDSVTQRQVGFWLDELTKDEFTEIVAQVFKDVGRALYAEESQTNKKQAEGEVIDAGPLAPVEHPPGQAAVGTGMAS